MHKKMIANLFIHILANFFIPYELIYMEIFLATAPLMKSKVNISLPGAVIGVITGKITNQIFYFTEEKAPWQMSNTDSRFLGTAMK